jgi:2Fe-2S ferredoxin
MAKITYVAFDGTPHVVDVAPGLSVMLGAVRNGVPGIDADCGGACACGTCHVYVAPEWMERVGARTPIEEATLEFAEVVEPNSRLACQIAVDEALDGLVVRMPQSQR